MRRRPSDGLWTGPACFKQFSATRENNLVLPAKKQPFSLAQPAKSGHIPLALPAKYFSPTRERRDNFFSATRENL